uniref:Uncharacterized protein n=1 Tax=Heterorhabditis bacteriophora TaxID=37862 RepID=A0A1I7WAF1_HETBA
MVSGVVEEERQVPRRRRRTRLLPRCGSAASLWHSKLNCCSRLDKIKEVACKILFLASLEPGKRNFRTRFVMPNGRYRGGKVIYIDTENTLYVFC